MLSAKHLLDLTTGMRSNASRPHTGGLIELLNSLWRGQPIAEPVLEAVEVGITRRVREVAMRNERNKANLRLLGAGDLQALSKFHYICERSQAVWRRGGLLHG